MRLYLYKNCLQKQRNLGVTCCELLTPIVLVALFAWLYTAVDVTDFPEATYECYVTSTVGGALASLL